MSQRRDHWKISLAAGGLLLAASLLAGCGGSSDGGAAQLSSPPPSSTNSPPPAVAAAKAANTPVDPGIVAADNAFGLSLLATLIQGGPGTNTAISPVSVAICLQIAYNGAQGTTQPAMARALQLGSLTLSQLNDDNAALLAALLEPDPQVTLTVANSLWVLQGSDSVVPAFVSTDRTYYGAMIGDLGGAPADVNEWVNTQTNGEITQILPSDMDMSKIVAILANAIYFKGSWQSAFDPGHTAAAPFTLADGTQATVQMMRENQAHLPYLQGQNFQAISVPYGQGRLSMLIVLPTAGIDLGDFVGSMTPTDIDGWVGEMSSDRPVDLNLPRFTTTYSQSLVSALSTLGMGIAFQPHVGDLSGIFPNAYISAVQHATVVHVDETGTVASGSTTVPVGTTAVEEPVVVHMSRPFFYAIRDNQTGALLFVGVMMNPNGG
jgi:serine protease inhibitor